MSDPAPTWQFPSAVPERALFIASRYRSTHRPTHLRLARRADEPVGTRPGGWPSGIRKVGATPPVHLSVDEEVKPIEQQAQSVEALDTLEPFHTAQLKRPG